MTLKSRFGRISGNIAAILILSTMMVSCDLAKNQLQLDRSADLSLQDYRDALAPMPVPNAEKDTTPDFAPVLSTPQELRLPTPLVTISVNQTVGLRDLLFQLAQQAGVDVEIDPQIHGSIIFTAKDRPFDEVIDRICALASLRYKFKNNVLRVELDRPYVKNYMVDYINAERKTASSIKTSISLSSAAGDTASGGGGGGSDTSVSTDIKGDLWKGLHDGLEQILTSSDTFISLATLSDPVAAPVNPLPPLPTATKTPDGKDIPPPPPPAPGSPEVAPVSPATPVTLNITTPPGAPMVPNPPATFSISQDSGIVSVFATDRQQRIVQKFLDDFRRRATTQVLIEAKVLQVELNDEYAEGIDWQKMNLTGLMNLQGSFLKPDFATSTNSNFTATFEPGTDINAVMQSISRFGSVRALSSPRVTVMNNQTAIVNVAQNVVYFTFNATPGTTDSNGNVTATTITTSQKSVPEGVLLSVVPTANPDTGEILLVVRPTVSKISSYATDPTVGLTLALNNQNPSLVPNTQVPQVSVQEIDSILRLQSGQIMAMGGLMKDNNSGTEEGIPLAADIPLVGNLFKNHVDHIQKSELVIFIKASIVGGNNIDNEERKVYKTFSLDRHPARM
ncbi:MAG: type II and III secretion system family protein [Alphaproteobacteria bacterium]|nr:type II and III secretion system family protein [Alphaproteobacteria bacterium]